MNIQTRYYRPPIASRKYDWEAYVPETLNQVCCQDPDCGCFKRVKIGFGETEAEALADLMEQLEGMETQ